MCDWTCAAAHQAAAATKDNCHTTPGPAQTTTFASAHACHELPAPTAFIGTWAIPVVDASLFNGREPDEQRWDLDLAALDSISGRVSFVPSDDFVLQVSAGHLNEAEADEGSLARIDVDRVTASVTDHRCVSAQNLWASTLAWGRNEESGVGSHVVLLESSLTRGSGTCGSAASKSVGNRRMTWTSMN